MFMVWSEAQEKEWYALSAQTNLFLIFCCLQELYFTQERFALQSNIRIMQDV